MCPLLATFRSEKSRLFIDNCRCNTMATGRAIAKKALDQLSLTLSSDDTRFFLDTSLEDLWKEARTIEYEQAQRRDLRCMRRIEGFLRTMESYSGIIEVFCQGFSPMSFVWVSLFWDESRRSQIANFLIGTYQARPSCKYSNRIFVSTLSLTFRYSS